MLRKIVLLVAGAIAAVIASSNTAEAIPAFARKYQFSCSTCHAPVPRLKAFGEEFAARGFRLDPAQEPPRATIDTGDPTLRLLRELPIAVRVDGFGSWKEGALAEADIEWPWSFKLLSGGPISESISYYVYFILEKGGVQGLEDAYLQFNSPFKLPISLMVGQFQVSDPLFKRELRLERFDYQIFKTRVGLAPADLTYDRGIIGSWTFPGDLDSVVQLVNGNGIREAEHDDFDQDSLKTVSWRLSRQSGPVRLGVFSYFGKQRSSGDVRNRTWYLGPDLVVDFTDSLQLNAQYLERRDDDPFFTGVRAGEWETRGGFAELHYLPRGADGPWVLSLLYNKVDSDDPNALWHSASLTVTRLLARNVKLMFEGGREIEHDAGRVSIGIVAAF
ncbi:MAG TPA: hypothetical protein VK886_12835 [Vicinamibacterales bacterium]|nr:hypothetical protein [Vicinamibacterales bacterium]